MREIHFDLDFKPRHPQQGIFPVFVWKSWALNHFAFTDTSGIPAQDVSHKEFHDVLHQLYPALTLMELARLFFKAQQIQVLKDLDWQALFRQYNYLWNERLQKIVELMVSLPQNFQDWMEKHQASPRDIAPLLSLKDHNLLQEVFTIISHQNLSRSHGAQALELTVDLFLLNSQLTLPLKGESTEGWLERLKKIRYPMTHASDEHIAHSLLNLPWTKIFNRKWVRSGDRSGLEVRFLAFSKEDLKSKTHELQKMIDMESK